MNQRNNEHLRLQIVELLKMFRSDKEFCKDHVWLNQEVERIWYPTTGNGGKAIETDQSYYDRLFKLVQEYGCFSTSDAALLTERMMQRMYIARNITLDEKTIQDVLSDMDKYSNRWDDHNGEASEHDVRIQAWKVIRELKKKYQV